MKGCKIGKTQQNHWQCLGFEHHPVSDFLRLHPIDLVTDDQLNVASMEQSICSSGIRGVLKQSLRYLNLVGDGVSLDALLGLYPEAGLMEVVKMITYGKWFAICCCRMVRTSIRESMRWERLTH
jgi:hypothetical protein